MSNFYRLTLILLLSALWITGAIYDYNYWDSSKTKAYAWNYTLEKDNVKYYQEYLNKHPNNQHSAKAIKLLKNAMIRKESTDWKNTKNINTAEYFHKFLKQYPKTEHKGEISKALDQISKDKTYAEANNLWLNIVKQLQKRDNIYNNLTDKGVVTSGTKEFEINALKKGKSKKIIPVVETIINNSVIYPTIVYKKNGKFVQINTKGRDKKLNKNILKVASVILKNKYRENEINEKKGAVLVLPRKYTKKDKSRLEKIVMNLVEQMALATNHDQYKLKLLMFWHILESESIDSITLISENAYTSKEAYKSYARKKYFVSDLVNNKKRWSYASGYIFGRIIQTTPLPLNEDQVTKGINDGIKLTSPHFSFKKINNILTEFSTSSENWKLLSKKKTHYKRLSYAMGYLFGSKIKTYTHPVVISSSAKGIAHGSARYKPQFGINVRQQKNWSVNKFFTENSIFSTSVE